MILVDVFLSKHPIGRKSPGPATPVLVTYFLKTSTLKYLRKKKRRWCWEAFGKKILDVRISSQNVEKFEENFFKIWAAPRPAPPNLDTSGPKSRNTQWLNLFIKSGNLPPSSRNEFLNKKRWIYNTNFNFELFYFIIISTKLLWTCSKYTLVFYKTKHS